MEKHANVRQTEENIVFTPNLVAVVNVCIYSDLLCIADLLLNTFLFVCFWPPKRIQQDDSLKLKPRLQMGDKKGF